MSINIIFANISTITIICKTLMISIILIIFFIILITLLATFTTTYPLVLHLLSILQFFCFF